jgi:hypothetical protein
LGNFSAHYQGFSAVQSALVSFMQQSQDGILTLLEVVLKNLPETYQCQLYSGKLLMMGREVSQNMWSFITE